MLSDLLRSTRFACRDRIQEFPGVRALQNQVTARSKIVQLPDFGSE